MFISILATLCDIIEMNINLQAKFLKACGTIVETPAEIRKASRKLLGSPHNDRDLEPSKYQSLPNASLETHSDLPCTPIKHLEEWGDESGSAERTPSRL